MQLSRIGVRGGRLPPPCRGRVGPPARPPRAAPSGPDYDDDLFDSTALRMVDLVQWPPGLKPTRSDRVTKSALSKFKVAELRSELARKHSPLEGKKAQLVDRLLSVIQVEADLLELDRNGPGAMPLTDVDINVPGPAPAHSPLRVAAAPRDLFEDWGLEDELAPPRATAGAGIATLEGPALVDDGAPGSYSSDSYTTDSQEEEYPFDYLDDGDDHDLDLLSRMPVVPFHPVRRRRDRSRSPSPSPPSRAAAALADGRAGEGQPDRESASSSGRRDAQGGGAPRSGPPIGADGGGGRRPERAALLDLASMQEEERLQHLNGAPSGLVLTLLGVPSVSGRPPCTVLRSTMGSWLFDVGEDTQRTLLINAHVRPSKISRIFVTAATGDRVWGLPGMLCTIAASKSKGHQKNDTPMHVFGPPGLAGYLLDQLEVSDTFLEMPVLVHELMMGPVAEEEQSPLQLSFRAKLWRVRISPDGYNLDGFWDAAITGTALLSRKFTQRSKAKREVDSRSIFRPHDLPAPGDPDRPPLPLPALRWTLRLDSQNVVVAGLLKHSQPSWAYTTVEADRAGNLSVQRCQELGLEPGLAYSDLKAGRGVTTPSGVWVPPSRVVSPDIEGRRVVNLGPLSDPSSAAVHIQDADLVVCPEIVVPAADGRPDPEAGLAAAVEMGRVAERAAVGVLVMGKTHGVDAARYREAIGAAFSGTVQLARESLVLVFDRKEPQP